jgi:polyisoprenoid-binding protein YceI
MGTQAGSGPAACHQTSRQRWAAKRHPEITFRSAAVRLANNRRRVGLRHCPRRTPLSHDKPRQKNEIRYELSAARGRLDLDQEGSSIGFEAKVFLGLKVTGQFDRYDSAITFGATAAECSISLAAWTDSVQTGDKTRDGHLRADNVFASARILTLGFHGTTMIETPTGLDIPVPSASAT